MAVEVLEISFENQKDNCTDQFFIKHQVRDARNNNSIMYYISNYIDYGSSNKI